MNRDPRSLEIAGADRIWVDTTNSDRMERADLFANGLKPGTVLVLLSRSDLGIGREIKRFEALADQIGATIEIAERVTPKPLKRGPRSKFQPTPKQRARIAHYWKGPFKLSFALQKATEIMGYEVSRNMLNRGIGPRGVTTAKEAEE